jgi:hypothetical protein
MKNFQGNLLLEFSPVGNITPAIFAISNPQINFFFTVAIQTKINEISVVHGLNQIETFQFNFNVDKFVVHRNGSFYYFYDHENAKLRVFTCKKNVKILLFKNFSS